MMMIILTTPLATATPISYGSGKFRQWESTYGCVWSFFFFPHAQTRHYLCFLSETLLSSSFSATSFSGERTEIWRLDNVSDNFLAKFLRPCAETATSELPTTIVTTTLDSATLISYKRRNFRQSESVYSRFGPFFFAHGQNRHYLCFRSEVCYHRRSRRHRVSINGWKCLAISQRFGYFFSHMFTAHAQKELFLSFRLKLWQPHWIQRPLFPIRGRYFSNRSTYSVLFAFYPEIRHISVSDLLDLISWKAGHVLPWRVTQIWSWSDYPLSRWRLYLQYVTLHCELDDWPFDLERLSKIFRHAV